MSNITNRFAQAAKQNAAPVDTDAVLNEAVNLLDSHAKQESGHVDLIEHLFTPKVVKALKDAEILEANKFYSNRQAAGVIWLMWKSM